MIDVIQYALIILLILANVFLYNHYEDKIKKMRSRYSVDNYAAYTRGYNQGLNVGRTLCESNHKSRRGSHRAQERGNSQFSQGL